MSRTNSYPAEPVIPEGSGVPTERANVYDRFIGDNVSVILSKENVPVAVNSGIGLADYSGAVSAVNVFLGVYNDTDNWTITKEDAGCASTLSGNVITITSLTGTVGYVDITLTKGSTVIIRRLGVYNTYWATDPLSEHIAFKATSVYLGHVRVDGTTIVINPTTGVISTSTTQFSSLQGSATDNMSLNQALSAKAPLTSPTFVTPNIGAATGTSFNGITGLSSTATDVKINGVQSAGSLSTVARADHIHPSDTAKANLASPTFTGVVVLPSTTSIGSVTNVEIGYLSGVTSSLQTQLGTKAPLVSPTFTGTPTAPTPPAGDSSTKVATTAFVQQMASLGQTVFGDLIVKGNIYAYDNIVGHTLGGTGAPPSDPLSVHMATKGSDTVLGHFKVGAYLTVDENGVLNGQAGGSGGAAVWGLVTGTLTDQLDLNTALGLKANLISPSFTTPILGTPQSGTLINCTFPTLNQNTTGSAGSLKSTGTTGLLTVVGMGTGTTRAKTVRDANDTILELGGSYTPTGIWTSLRLNEDVQLTATSTKLNYLTSAAGTTGTASTNLVFSTSPTLVTPILGTPQSGNLANCTFPTLNQNTTGSALYLKDAETTGKMSVIGITAGENVEKSVSSENDTLLELEGSYSPTGIWSSLRLNENVLLTTTSTKLNYLTSATGTTGTASTNVVFSASPTLTGTVLVQGTTKSRIVQIVDGSDVIKWTIKLSTNNLEFYKGDSTEVEMRLYDTGELKCRGNITAHSSMT
jgi:hypothetical protein